MSSSSLADARCVCGALRRATRAVSRHFDEYLVPAGMTIARYGMLLTLERLGEPTVGAFARDLGVERTTALRNLRPLLDEGLVRVGPARAGRSNIVSLTRAGTASLEAARPHWRRAQSALERKIGPADVERLLAITAALA